jgi:DNA-binding MarR family transcriptional regulator
VGIRQPDTVGPVRDTRPGKPATESPVSRLDPTDPRVEAARAADSDPATRLRAAIGRLSRRLRQTVAGSGLTPTQTSVLFTVARLGPLGLSEISELEGINPTMLSRITAQLCESGLISRESDPGDRRAALVRVTPAGQRLRRRIHRERTEALQQPIATLTDEQRELLWSALPVLEALAEQLPRTRP